MRDARQCANSAPRGPAPRDAPGQHMLSQPPDEFVSILDGRLPNLGAMVFDREARLPRRLRVFIVRCEIRKWRVMQ
jgi:hypothetical protein